MSRMILIKIWQKAKLRWLDNYYLVFILLLTHTSKSVVSEGFTGHRIPGKGQIYFPSIDQAPPRRVAFCLRASEAADDLRLKSAREGPLSGTPLHQNGVLVGWGEGIRGICRAHYNCRKRKKPAEPIQTGFSGVWPPIVDAYRTLCIEPPPDVRIVFESLEA